MANVIIYDVKTGAIEQYLTSVSTTKFNTRLDTLMNPDVTLLKTVDRKFLKVADGKIAELKQIDKDAITLKETEAKNTVTTLKSSAKSKLNELGFTDDELPYIGSNV